MESEHWFAAPVSGWPGISIIAQNKNNLEDSPFIRSIRETLMFGMCSLQNDRGKDKAKHLLQILSFFVRKTSIFSTKPPLFRRFCHALTLGIPQLARMLPTSNSRR
jgi:hypothetical protein